MNTLTLYIIEKLHLNKDTKVETRIKSRKDLRMFLDQTFKADRGFERIKETEDFTAYCRNDNDRNDLINAFGERIVTQLAKEEKDINRNQAYAYTWNLDDLYYDDEFYKDCDAIYDFIVDSFSKYYETKIKKVI